ncbi:YceD family protein [Desulfocastanea catecholica]
MKLFFEEITGRAARFTLQDSSWLSHGDDDLNLIATANICVSRRDSETVHLKGKIAGHRLAVCDRCGEQVRENVLWDFVYLVTTRKEQALELREIECSDDDAITLYLKEAEIDVDEILREQSYLAIPLRTLCSEDCKGICAGCGNALNSGDCACSLEKSDSPFAVLKKLTNR